MAGDKLRIYIFLSLAIIFNVLFLFSPVFEVIPYETDIYGNSRLPEKITGGKILAFGLLRAFLDYFFLLVRFFSMNLMPDSNGFYGYLFFIVAEILFVYSIIELSMNKSSKKITVADILIFISTILFFFCFEDDSLSEELIGKKYEGYFYYAISYFFLCCAMISLNLSKTPDKIRVSKKSSDNLKQ